VGAGVVGDVEAVVELEHRERRQALDLDPQRRADLDVDRAGRAAARRRVGVAHGAQKKRSKWSCACGTLLSATRRRIVASTIGGGPAK
jgi:hypothetical protein